MLIILITTVIAALLLFLITYVPIAAFVVISITILIVIVQGIFQILCAVIRPVVLEQDTELNKNSITSIHVATYNEPPVLLKNTLRSFKDIVGVKYEVLVIDNNTKDENIWKPVEEYVKELGHPFYFFHVDPLSGFKAGALNYVTQKSNPEAQFISTIDADYDVEHNYLIEGLSYFVDPSVGFVQFPQAYKNVDKTNIGILLEYEHFFANYMNSANYLKSVSATGTLTFFRIEALKKVGLFNTVSITEDADIGIRLTLAGYRGIYVDKVIGTGLMPYDLEAYRKQKDRWARGNAEALRTYFYSILTSRFIKWRQKLAIISQLTAWLNATYILELALFTSLLISLALPEEFWPLFLYVYSFLGIVVFLVLKLVSFIYTFSYKYSFKKIIKAFLIHIGMNWTYSISLFKGLFSQSTYFERTNKFILPKMPSLIKNTFPELILCGLSILFISILLYKGFVLETIPLYFIIIIHVLIFYAWKELSETKKVSAQIIDKIEQSFT